MRATWAIGLLLASTARAEPLAIDDVLLDHFGGKVQQFRGGNLLDTFSSTTDAWAGVTATRAGDVAIVHRTPGDGLERFTPAGAGIDDSPIAGLAVPTDLDVFSDGTFVIANQNGNDLKLVDAARAVVDTFSNGAMLAPFGLDVAPDDSVWVASRGSQDVDHFDRLGNDVGGFALGFEPGEIVIDPADGTLWIANRLTGAIAHRSAAGADLGGVATGITTNASFPLSGLGITSGGILLVLDVVGGDVLDGTPVGSFPIPTPDNPFRISVVPEPVAAPATLAAAAALLALARSRRRGAATNLVNAVCTCGDAEAGGDGAQLRSAGAVIPTRP